MSHDPVVIDFADAWKVAGNRLANSFTEALQDVNPRITLNRQRNRADAQDFGITLAVMLGTAAATAVANTFLAPMEARIITEAFDSNHPPVGRVSLRMSMSIVVSMLALLLCSCRSPVRPPLSPPAPPPVVPSFPWPPPAASGREVVTGDLLKGRSRLNSLGDLDAILTAALNKNGYYERGYYSVPNGFAMATRFEQFGSDGASKAEPDRWCAGALQPFSFDLGNYVLLLLTGRGKPEYCRVIVFIVSDVPFSQTDATVNWEQAQQWTRRGANILPAEIASLPYTPRVACTALVYEFKRDDSGQARLLQPGYLDAHTHLLKSGLWQSLQATM